MKMLAESPWEWQLFAEGDRFIVSVICGSVALYTRYVVLSQQQKDAYLGASEPCAAELIIQEFAHRVRQHGERDNAGVALSAAEQDAMQLAIQEWRENALSS
uniref:hypothetical protein n=1 Tax=Thaumasiovibrio occultus TaxID=1891184 RepID=UPI000B351330|nr:hypothetical protein [Thaumasiovibrio occultus]